MRTAKVITTEISGRGNKIHCYGEIVRENQFAAGAFDKLINGKFLEEQIAVDESNSFAGDQDKGGDGNADIGSSQEEKESNQENQSTGKKKKKGRFGSSKE